MQVQMQVQVQVQVQEEQEQEDQEQEEQEVQVDRTFMSVSSLAGGSLGCTHHSSRIRCRTTLSTFIHVKKNSGGQGRFLRWGSLNSKGLKIERMRKSSYH